MQTVTFLRCYLLERHVVIRAHGILVAGTGFKIMCVGEEVGLSVKQDRP